MFAIGSIRGSIIVGLKTTIRRESLVWYSFLVQKEPNGSSFLQVTSVTPSLDYIPFVHLRSYGTALPFQETPNVSSPYFLRTQRFNAFAGHSFLANQIHGRFMSSASIELKTDSTVVRFSISKQHDKNGSSEKGKKTTKRVKMSRKAKLNELRFYRLKAKKKMNSPNPEVRIRYKLEKAKRKEAWLIEKLRKFEVPKMPAETYDPEILTEEEKHYLKRTGEKKKNFILVGRRGVFGGVVLNMHLHWKKHETVKVICKPCKPGQIHEYAEELTRLSKGIVIDIKPNNTIIFYRGKNYVQPEVMSPQDTLSKQKYEDAMNHNCS
ncbi:uncharacterized CRM domain-containing protein At3g25440, chloroplastic isoform X2 [Manihot esculenta]|uniref:uncharacterized CRM domain-containing protein At3g25440, chloroplastic isoform X2 n=1 Tax=Manihot esculenta TaxID=3983 RepID=UPI001CC40B46|nr:uncharacterized CRM domain-containing protein At3g25440, chloroplastic isoform X2 [Manihot esculenta]